MRLRNFPISFRGISFSVGFSSALRWHPFVKPPCHTFLEKKSKHIHDVQKISLTCRPQGHSHSVRMDLAILTSVMMRSFAVKLSAKSQIAAASHT